MCLNCGGGNSRGAVQCAECGAGLDDTSAAAGASIFFGERRQLTALFCDIVDSTEIATTHDPEEYHELIRAFSQCCRAVVDQFGGMIKELRGDGALLLFGYPQSRGDEPERAVRAGLALIDAIKRCEFPGGFSVRIGIATGLTAIDASTSFDPTIVGEALNLAARLQNEAAPGTVVISELTRNMAGGFFETVDLGLQDLKGFAEPVPAWLVTREAKVFSRFEALRLGGTADFVGRHEETRTLAAQWEQAKLGSGRVIIISGEPGIGKSRLIRHLREQVRGQARALEYFGSPYHTNTTLHPIIEHITRISGLGAEASAEARLKALRQVMKHLGNGYEAHLPWMATLMSLPDTSLPDAVPPQERREKTFEALMWWTRALARDKPLLIMVDDAHWADPTSLEFMRGVAERVPALPALMIISFRSPYRHDLDIPHIRFDLDRFEAAESAALVVRIAGKQPLSSELVRRIVAKTDGNPLFVEEMTKVVLGTAAGEQARRPATNGGHREELPATLHDSLMARLDQFAPVKRLAQTAAVIGREFLYDTLLAVSGIAADRLDIALSQLAEAELIYADAPAPDRQFIFKHALVRDAAYESLLKRDRRRLHGKVADALEAQFSRSAAVDPELLAHHYTEAGLTKPAVHYWELAAHRAFQRFSNLEALAHASRALDLIALLPDDEARQRLELNLRILAGGSCWAVKGFGSRDVEQSFARALELAETLGDTEQTIIAQRGLFGCHYIRGELSHADEHAEGVMALALKSGSADDLMVGHMMRGSLQFWRGEFQQARSELNSALPLYDPTRQATKLLSSQIDPAVNVRVHLGWTLWCLGYPDRALVVSEDGVAAARRIAQPLSLAMALFWNAAVKLCRGEVAAAEMAAEELGTVTSKHHIAYLGACAAVLKAAVLIASGEPSRGVVSIQQAFAAFRSQQSGLGVPWTLSLAATGHLRNGKYRDALNLIAAGLEIAKRTGERQWEAELLRLKGECLACLPDTDPCDAEACVRQALDLARRQNARSLELRAASTLAGILKAGKRRLEARTILEDVCSRFCEGHETSDLREAKRLLDESQDLEPFEREAS